MRTRFPLRLEILLARATGGLSRLARTGGGTTVPGKLLWKLDPDAIDELAAGCRSGSALVSATNGKTTTAAMAAEILGGRLRLAHNSSGANLVSGIASTLLAARDAELGLFEVDEAALPEVGPARAAPGGLPRQSLSRPARPLRRARARRRALAAAVERASCRTRALVVNGDDPQVGDLGLDRDGRPSSASTTLAHAGPALQHAADSKWCIRCGTPYDYAAAYVGHLGDYRCPACGHARPPLDVVARDARARRASTRVSFELVDARGRRGGCACGFRASTTSTTRSAAAALALRSASSLDEVEAGLEALQRRVRPLRADRGRRAGGCSCC